MLYLATPYAHRDEEVRELRFRAAAAYAAELMIRGHYVFAPIAHSHPLHKWGNAPAGWGWWKGFDLWFLAKCDKLIVLMLEGWEESTGVREEVEFAVANNIPVEYVNPAEGTL